MNTNLLYLENNNLLGSESKVVDIVDDEGKIGLILDKTIFYPQGGGQPYDKGIIENQNGKFIVEEVRFVDGVVKHYGHFESGIIKPKENVKISVDHDRRLLNSQIHSAGHLVDLVLDNLGYTWEPGKGYHFPEGPYVEYSGSLENIDKEKLIADLENGCNRIIKEGLPVTFKFISAPEVQKLCRYVPENIPQDKPLRIVLFGDWASPCGGTHVANLSDIGDITIRKIKTSGEGIIRISYALRLEQTNGY